MFPVEFVIEDSIAVRVFAFLDCRQVPVGKTRPGYVIEFEFEPENIVYEKFTI